FPDNSLPPLVFSTDSIGRTLQNFQIPASLLTPPRSSAKSPQINIRCPPGQGTTQHYGYRVDQNYLLYVESILKADPTVDRDDFYNPLSFTHRYCIDPEQRPIVPLDPMYDTGPHFENARDEDDDEDDGEYLLSVMSMCTDDPSSFLNLGGGLVMGAGVHSYQYSQRYTYVWDGNSWSQKRTIPLHE
ncbi:hypothetical protein AZE42_12160, partial [Rhizopogon vesiculosus]